MCAAVCRVGLSLIQCGIISGECGGDGGIGLWQINNTLQVGVVAFIRKVFAVLIPLHTHASDSRLESAITYAIEKRIRHAELRDGRLVTCLAGDGDSAEFTVEWHLFTYAAQN